MIASAIITIKDLREIEVGATAPANPTENTIWIDTSVTPNVEKRWTGSAWVVINDVSQNTVVTQLSSRLTTAEGHIDAVVDEVWPDGTSQSSAISVQAGQISSISSTVDGHTTKITQQGNALQMDAQGNSGLASRVTVAEGNISTLSSNVSGHSTAIQQNANKIALIATGDSAATLELTDAAMSFIGNNVELSANNSVNIRIGTAEQNIQDVANTAQGAVDAANAVQTSLNATTETISAQIASQGEILSMMELTAGGLKVKTGDSIYSTLTDGEGFHVYQENTRIASFANNGVTAHSFTMGRVVCRKSSSGGWAWNLVS